MVQDILGFVVLGVVYVCLAIIVFAPTMYAFWFYLVGRRVSGPGKRFPYTVITVFLLNLLFAYVLGHLAFTYLIQPGVDRANSQAMQAVKSAIAAQEKYHAVHGRYYSLGPVRGPHTGKHGTVVEEDVVLRVEPTWIEDKGQDGFVAQAIHVWGRGAVVATSEKGPWLQPADSTEAQLIRAKLMSSVK
jgi:hypothetical protein